MSDVYGTFLAVDFWDKVDRSGVGCWEWTGRRYGDGYGEWREPGGRRMVAHRKAWELANGTPPPREMLVCHRCDNPPCVRPDHLFLGTYSDNERDKIAKMRHPDRRGEKSASAKLTAEEVLQIRELLADPLYVQWSFTRIAHAIGLRYNYVQSIGRGKTWKHLPGPQPLPRDGRERTCRTCRTPKSEVRNRLVCRPCAARKQREWRGGQPSEKAG